MTAPLDEPVNTRSLRLRIGLTVLSLLAVVLVALGVIVNAVLKDRLESDLHQRLRDRAGVAQALSGQGLSSQQLSDRLTGAGVTASVTTAAGVTVGRDQPRFGRPPGGPPPARVATTPANVTINQDGPVLSAQVRLTEGTVTLTTSLVEIDRTLDTLRTIEFIAGAATLLLVALLLWRLVAVALAPLDRMTRLARRIRDGARGRRLRPTKPGTELGRTAIAFDDMLDSLESAEAEAQSAELRMRQFLADASHDLRTPLAGVITTAEQVLRDNPGRLEREQRLVTVIREAQRAGRLVDDLLLITRLDDTAPPPVAVAPVDVVAVARAVAEPAGAAVIVAGAPSAWARAERDALHRILANLVSNARHASPVGQPVRIEIAGTAGTVEIRVSDGGPGVPPDQRERIFDRFVRLADSTDGRPADGGHGLGLPIARGLARRFGGDVRYADGPTGGTTFLVTFPAAIGQPDLDDRTAQTLPDPVLERA